MSPPSKDKARGSLPLRKQDSTTSRPLHHLKSVFGATPSSFRTLTHCIIVLHVITRSGTLPFSRPLVQSLLHPANTYWHLVQLSHCAGQGGGKRKMPVMCCLQAAHSSLGNSHAREIEKKDRKKEEIKSRVVRYWLWQILVRFSGGNHLARSRWRSVARAAWAGGSRPRRAFWVVEPEWWHGSGSKHLTGGVCWEPASLTSVVMNQGRKGTVEWGRDFPA